MGALDGLFSIKRHKPSWDLSKGIFMIKVTCNSSCYYGFFILFLSTTSGFFKNFLETFSLLSGFWCIDLILNSPRKFLNLIKLINHYYSTDVWIMFIKWPLFRSWNWVPAMQYYFKQFYSAIMNKHPLMYKCYIFTM